MEVSPWLWMFLFSIFSFLLFTFREINRNLFLRFHSLRISNLGIGVLFASCCLSSFYRSLPWPMVLSSMVQFPTVNCGLKILRGKFQNKKLVSFRVCSVPGAWWNLDPSALSCPWSALLSLCPAYPLSRGHQLVGHSAASQLSHQHCAIAVCVFR